MTPTTHRTDIDGLRAIAVLAVMAFHFGYFPNGYLGVDVFFAISGYLITGIIYNESIENRFSLKQFYIRRVRRIIPLILFIDLVALITGLLVMLPDDLENLSQSIIATNFFSNNILQEVTTKNYWDAANEYKPLMHTWSLGIEEQFYLLYPIPFLLLRKANPRWLTILLLLLTTASLYLLFAPYGLHRKFYLLPFRFFELSSGGLLAIITRGKVMPAWLQNAGILLLLAIFLFAAPLPGNVKICLTVLATILILAHTPNTGMRTNLLLQNTPLVAIGNISFSLYMWHQLVLAFTRYFVLQHITPVHTILILALIFLLATATYFLIEQPFRNAKKIGAKTLLWVTGITFLLTTSASWYIYRSAGVMHDVPELDITKAAAKTDMHAQYNESAYDLNKSFDTGSKIKVLIVGNSFARDWVNVLRESKYYSRLDISYVPNMRTCTDINTRLQQAQYILFSERRKKHIALFMETYPIDTSKVWIIGTKNFGTNNGIFYNKRRDKNYYTQRTLPISTFKTLNDSLKHDWGNRYIDLLTMVSDKNGTVPVFTPQHKFISQDCRHLTQNGAIYFARLLEQRGFLDFE